jgi:hypothetical protein
MFGDEGTLELDTASLRCYEGAGNPIGSKRGQGAQKTALRWAFRKPTPQE